MRFHEIPSLVFSQTDFEEKRGTVTDKRTGKTYKPSAGYVAAWLRWVKEGKRDIWYREAYGKEPEYDSRKKAA